MFQFDAAPKRIAATGPREKAGAASSSTAPDSKLPFSLESSGGTVRRESRHLSFSPDGMMLLNAMSNSVIDFHTLPVNTFIGKSSVMMSVTVLLRHSR